MKFRVKLNRRDRETLYQTRCLVQAIASVSREDTDAETAAELTNLAEEIDTALAEFEKFVEKLAPKKSLYQPSTEDLPF